MVTIGMGTLALQGAAIPFAAPVGASLTVSS
jgi:hypothetical protein